jgi:hypothetical protein
LAWQLGRGISGGLGFSPSSMIFMPTSVKLESFARTLGYSMLPVCIRLYAKQGFVVAFSIWDIPLNVSSALSHRFLCFICDCAK